MSGRRSELKKAGSGIEHLVGQAQQNLADEEARAAGKTGKGKPGHAGRVGIDNRGRIKMTLRLDLDTQALIRDLAQTENVPNDEIVRAAVTLLAQAIRAGRLDLEPLKFTEFSKKQPWRGVTRLELPTEFDINDLHDAR